MSFLCSLVFFFFEQKTAYELRSSDWSSDVCSSDLRISLLFAAEAMRQLPTAAVTVQTPLEPTPADRIAGDVVVVPVLRAGLGMLEAVQLGRASCRERVRQYA